MNRKGLLEKIRVHYVKSLNGYINHPAIYSEEEILEHNYTGENKGISEYIVKTKIEKDLGIIAAAFVGASSEHTIDNAPYN